MRRAVLVGLVVPAVCAEKVKLAGEKSKDPPEKIPFPVTVIPWVPPALSLIVI